MILSGIWRKTPVNTKEVLKRYPRICAHIICHSLGYATPSCAAQILMDAKLGKPNYCEWIYCCYNKDPRPAVEWAIRNRHYHKGFMADYRSAKKLVDLAVEADKEPVFASWF